MNEEERSVWVFTLETTSFRLVELLNDVVEEMMSPVTLSYGWHKARKKEREITTADTDFMDHLGKPEILDKREERDP
jgi:hypothetical protein